MLGFSLIEVLIYTAIIGMVGSFFVGILYTVTRIQNQQSSSIEVNQQLNFILSTLQRLVRDSSLIDITVNVPTNSLKLRMHDPTKDPTIITLSNNRISIQEGGNPPSYLTASSVTADKLSFLKISKFPGHDSLQADITLSYNTQNPQQQFSKSITLGVARVSAATFDSDIVPGADNTYSVGLSSNRWQDLNLAGNLTVAGNGTISGNLGVGNANPVAKLDVIGEVKFSGVSGDGNGKAVCVKSDGTLGTCTNQPNSSGVCTCS